MKNIFKLMLLNLFLFSAYSSQAALISHNGYTLDTDTNIVTGGGLEWLQWDETTGESINSALSIYESQGWRVASNVEMASLFTHFFGSENTVTQEIDETTLTIIETLEPWDARENTGQSLSIFGLTTENFIELFGITRTDSITDEPQNPEPGQSIDRPLNISGAFFGLDLDGDGKYNAAEVFGDIFCLYTCMATTRTSSLYSDDVNPLPPGVALVRTPVPIPAAVWLFGSALIGLVSLKRK